jgi:hypothetical protein
MNTEFVEQLKKLSGGNKEQRKTALKTETNGINTKDLPSFVMEQMELIDVLHKQIQQLQKAFEIEKNCKNQVYYFILENGYFSEYADYTAKKPVQ